MSVGGPQPPVDVYKRNGDFGRRFEIVADLSYADDRTLEVSYDPDDVKIEVLLYNGHLCERAFAVPEWGDTKTTQAVLNNKILTISVFEK